MGVESHIVPNANEKQGPKTIITMDTVGVPLNSGLHAYLQCTT